MLWKAKQTAKSPCPTLQGQRLRSFLRNWQHLVEGALWAVPPYATLQVGDCAHCWLNWRLLVEGALRAVHTLICIDHSRFFFVFSFFPNLDVTPPCDDINAPQGGGVWAAGATLDRSVRGLQVAAWRGLSSML